MFIFVGMILGFHILTYLGHKVFRIAKRTFDRIIYVTICHPYPIIKQLLREYDAKKHENDDEDERIVWTNKCNCILPQYTNLDIIFLLLIF